MDYIKIAVIIGLIMIVTLIIFIIALDYKSSQLIIKLFERYKNGLNLYCASPDKLQERLIGIGFKDAEIVGDSVIVRQEKKRYRFYIKEGNVFADIKMEGLAISGISRIIKLFKKRGRLLSAVFYNKIMDILARTYNLEALVEDNGDYNKAEKFAKIYKVLSIGEVLFIVGWLIYAILYFLNDPIEQIKTGTFKDYPDKEIGKTFDSYFKNTKWEKAEKKDGNDVIKFTGYFPIKDSDGKEVEMSMDLTIVKDDIDFGNLTIYNKTRDENTSNIVLQKIIGKDDIQFSMEDILEMIKASDIENAENSEAKENNKVESKKNEEELNDKNEAVDNKKIENNDKIEDNPVEEEIEENTEDTANADYIIPYSDTRYLSQQDLMGMNKGTLRAARNEIYARYGRKFKAKDLQDYFNSKSWYHPTIEADQFTDNMLSETERHNANLIKEAETEAPAGELTIVNNELLSLGEKEKIVKNMNAYTTWEIEMKVMNEQTNEYDLWTIKDDLKNNVIAIKKNGSDWAYYDVNAGMSVGDPTFNTEQALMYDQTWISGFWNDKESIFKSFKPNDKYQEKDYVSYTYRSDDNPGIQIYTLKKDERGKLVVDNILVTYSSLNYPDMLIQYKYSNKPV